LVGLLAVAAAMYGLLAAGSPTAIGLPLRLGGVAIAAAAVLFGGHGVVRTKYRPDAWGGPEWLVTAAGVAAVLGVIGAGRLASGALHPSAYPLVAPALPWPAVAGIALALAPAFLKPRSPAPARQREPGELIGAAR
jgi:energy-coupling factor transport system permease protein